jgi:hypothetical protein
VYALKRAHIRAILVRCVNVSQPVSVTDPSAGSPTETLLRLLLPLIQRNRVLVTCEIAELIQYVFFCDGRFFFVSLSRVCAAYSFLFRSVDCQVL